MRTRKYQLGKSQVGKIWITLQEFERFFNTVTWIFSFSDYFVISKVFMRRIIALWKKSGSNFAFLYLKECMRLTTRALAGQPENQDDLESSRDSGKILVKRDKSGIPTIIPYDLRKSLLERNNKYVKFILTLLSIYRVFPTVQKPSLKTIIDPFTGSTKSFDLGLLGDALKDLLKNNKLRVRGHKLIRLNSASPVGSNSLWSSSSDLIPLIVSGKIFYVIKYLSTSFRGTLIGIWITILSFLSLPFSLVAYCRSVFKYTYAFEYFHFHFKGGLPFNVFTLKWGLPHKGKRGKSSWTMPGWFKPLTSWTDDGVYLVISLPYLIWFRELDVFDPKESMSSRALPVGKLSVVYDQAGKGRVIAITNYWLQVCLKPLHDAVFRLLQTIPQDGTFDQDLPLNNLLVDNGQKFSCFDLSAATDRLPLDLQRDILNLLKGKLGDSWARLLDINWLFKEQSVKYSVGQPMGAYSSWAMLALTHHVIVRVAALKNGIRDFQDYAVLGDDIVIKNDAVAKEYLYLMDSLGVSINMSKSLISTEFAEFAKRLKGPVYDFSPLGAGLILQYVRNKAYIGALLASAYQLNIERSYSAFLHILHNLKSYKTASYVGLWSVIGLNGAAFKLTDRDVSWLKKTIAILWASAKSDSIMVRCQVFNALLQVKIDKYHDNLRKFETEINYWNSHFFKVSTSRTWPLRMWDTFSRMISPAFWLTYYFFIWDYIRLWQTENTLYYKMYDVTWDEIIELSKDKEISVTSIDWRDKKAINQAGYYAKLIRFYALAYNVIVHNVDIDVEVYNSLCLRPDSLRELCDKNSEILAKVRVRPPVKSGRSASVKKIRTGASPRL